MEMTNGVSMSSLRMRSKLYKLLHQDAGHKGESVEERSIRRASERKKTEELLNQADPSLSELIHRYVIVS